jgi:hypothetical protein
MTTTKGVFLPDEQEQRIPRKSPQSVRVNGEEAKRVDRAKADPAKLNEQELKSAIISAWKKHEELVKKDLAPMLYWLRDKLRAQGARNDISDKDRGFGFWVEEHLDISRRTADRWCEWYAVEAGLKEPTSSHVSKSDLEMAVQCLDTHKGKLQIAFNFWIPKSMHAQYQKALSHLQKQFGVKDKKEALVRGVIYAATVINSGRGHSKLVGKTASSQRPRIAESSRLSRKGVRHPVAIKRTLQNALRDTVRGSQAKRRKHEAQSTDGHRTGGSSKAMRAAAGQ